MNKFFRSRALELIGLYAIPFMAKGINSGIMTALKISADNTADRGEFSFITLRASICGIAKVNMAGIIAKYLAISFAILNVVKAPLVINSCFPIETTSMILVGSESKSTIFAASLAAEVPLFI